MSLLLLLQLGGRGGYDAAVPTKEEGHVVFAWNLEETKCERKTVKELTVR